jgi:putative ABC transport system substrate-binding protein
MRRRDFITLLGGAAAGWPLSARGQQSTLPMVGILSSRSAEADADALAILRHGLSETGYVDGRSVAFEYRGADGQFARLPELAADLVRRQVTVIVTMGGPSPAVAVKAATSQIPIVAAGGDLVRAGLVANLNRPGGNVTGIFNFGEELNSKRLELLHELIPAASVIAVLIGNGSFDQLKDLEAAARTLRLQLHPLHASNDHEIEEAFASLIQIPAGALLVAVDPFFLARANQLTALAARHAVPTLYFRREFVAAGGLMSYGASYSDGYRQAGVYIGRILKGERPADLPVQQPTKFELVINLKAARTLGLAVPSTLQSIADEVIE